MAVAVLSDKASAVTQRSISMPSACSCFCAPQPPCAILGGGLVQRRETPANKPCHSRFIEQSNQDLNAKAQGEKGAKVLWASGSPSLLTFSRIENILQTVSAKCFRKPRRALRMPRMSEPI